MENLSMCRICLATDFRLCSIASHLRDMYERITAMTFKREDRRPLEACYICYARLQNCYRLRTSCLQSEELLTEMISSSVLKPQDVLSTNSFSVVSAVHISIGHILLETTECHIKEEAPEITCDAELHLQYTKDLIKEEQDAQIDDTNQCSHLEDPLDVINRDATDVLTDAEDIKLEEDITIEKNEPYYTGPSSQSMDNINPKIVKVVVERIDVNDTRTDIPVLKKLSETESHLVTEYENKNIVFDNLIASSNISETNDKIGAALPKHEDNEVIAHYEVNKKTSNSNINSNKKYFRSKVNLEYRSCTRTSEKRFICDVCNKCFRHKQNLIQHLYIHSGEKRFQCHICNKCFRSAYNLTRHMYTHTNEKRFQCDVCNKYMSSKYNLTQHISTHVNEKQFRCDMCNKFFRIKQQLKRHMNTHTGEKRFQCDVCHKRLSSKQNLTQHMYKHTNDKRFACDVCIKCFGSKELLSQHMYTHTGEKRFQCDVCHKRLSSKQNLTQHMYKHTNDKRFACDLCIKCFGSKELLAQHMFSHTDAKRFQCELCNKCFKMKRHLAQHMFIHTGEKRLQCDVCNKCISSKYNLTQHMSTHTNEKRF